MNFIECEYFLDSDSPDFLALCETNLVWRYQNILNPNIMEEKSTKFTKLWYYIKSSTPPNMYYQHALKAFLSLLNFISKNCNLFFFFLIKFVKLSLTGCICYIYAFFLFIFVNYIKRNYFFFTSWNFSSKPVLPLSSLNNFMEFAVPFVKQSASCSSLLHHYNQALFFHGNHFTNNNISFCNLFSVTVSVDCMESIRDLLSI